jgi:hypothetical protein
MKHGQKFLMFSIICDMVTTLFGLYYGLTESNPIGLNAVLLSNCMVLIFLWIKRNEVLPTWMNVIIYIIGIYRTSVAIWNMYSITIFCSAATTCLGW